jgi:hypothetical protein
MGSSWRQASTASEWCIWIVPPFPSLARPLRDPPFDPLLLIQTSFWSNSYLERKCVGFIITSPRLPLLLHPTYEIHMLFVKIVWCPSRSSATQSMSSSITRFRWKPMNGDHILKRALWENVNGWHRGGRPIFISIKVLINGFWRNKIYYTNAVLLLVWPIRVAIFVAEKQLINTSMEINKHLNWIDTSSHSGFIHASTLPGPDFLL